MATLPGMATLLGFDPGRDKCGLAVLADAHPIAHEVVPAAVALATIAAWRDRYGSVQLVMGDRTTSREWQARIRAQIPDLAIALVDERNSTLEARDRYWQMYPPRGLMRLIPQGMRLPPRPVDDIAAILLVERYLQLRS
ncbi:putative endonuclease involved in recombination [Rubidibacter lacunae KORDI 51-2]|uniref:Putative endonuclease involved in recombination n=1 Tax=Rubidibacter lacunae KORDI 51-2 TaxID=582515 RepID=U5DM94_9CHRO|nr:Holliday junction resolvase RuvX [Rubidibacter lacunae]ERN40835.1 putative endonuclease involved in recombination [Rubidibacter lacunae KORDI 51-2]